MTQLSTRIPSRTSRPKTTTSLVPYDFSDPETLVFPKKIIQSSGPITERAKTPATTIFQSVRWGDEFYIKKKPHNLRKVNLKLETYDSIETTLNQPSTTRSIHGGSSIFKESLPKTESCVLPQFTPKKKIFHRKVAGFIMNRIRK